MTRVNVGYPVSKLSDKMLLAEHREIKRIPNAVVSGKVNMADIPSTFTLGTGHVRFFYDKLGYLLGRYYSVYFECVRRGFNVTDFSGAWKHVPNILMGGYTPTEHDKEIIRDRIKERTTK